MYPIKKVNHLNLSEIETLVFSGGGNRCWWQAGILSELLTQEFCLPKQLIGTSAGAAIALSCLTDGPLAALESCANLFAGNSSIIDRTQLRRFKLGFAHEHIYPEWISSILNDSNFDILNKTHSKLRIAVTRPARILGVIGSATAGTLAYMIDKYLWHSIHPRLPKYLGLRQEFIDLHQCQTVADAQLLLTACASAPPFMPSRRIHGVIAMDGGYVDNAPIHKQTETEQSKTLILLTRYYKQLPPLFSLDGRIYWQPSHKIPVSTWDCTFRTTVKEAFIHGQNDALQRIHTGELVL